MTSYVNPFTNQTINPSQVGYESLTISSDTTLQWPVNGNTSNIVANIIQVTATTTGLSLFMPSAQQVSVGQSVIINNIGSNSFTVKNNTGGTIVSISSGISQFIYLTSNATDAGVWSSVTFGAGTSAANAATLAGYGLVATGSTLNQAYVVNDYYSNTTLDATDRAQFVVWGGGAGSITLPSSSTVGNNWFCMIRNNGTGILTVYPTGTDTIDGEISKQLQLTESFVVVANGTTGYNSFGYGQSVQFTYTILSLSVTGGTTTLSAAQASNVIQEYSGTLTSNQTIILPPTVQLYSVNNLTTGAYSLTLSTGIVGGSTVVVPQNQTLIVICDGTNVYNASSGSSSSITQLTLGNGSLGAPSLRFLGDLNSGMYLPATGKVGFVIGNAQAGFFDSTGFTSINGISGGTF